MQYNPFQMTLQIWDKKKLKNRRKLVVLLDNDSMQVEHIKFPLAEMEFDINKSNYLNSSD